MISYGWLVLAFFVGTVAGVFLLGLLAAGATESAYRAGFSEGHAEGFSDGLKELQKVG